MKNFAVKNFNGWKNVEGKVFLGQELAMTGAEASLQRLAVGEGSVVRVAPAGVRALRNTSDAEMVMMCIQYEAKPITSFMDDANIIK